VLLQRTDDDKVAKERMHLDLETDDIEAEVRRLEGLGATRSDHQQERGFDFWVLRDPWGNEFCVLHPNFPELLAPTPTMDQLGRVCNVTPAPARLLRWSPDPGWAADP
jgi:hypothetical protein